MIRLLLLLLLLFLVYTFFRFAVRTLSGGRGTLPPEKTRRGEDMVRDPQCGTYIPRGSALEKTVRGERHFFCSRECRDAYVRRD